MFNKIARLINRIRDEVWLQFSNGFRWWRLPGLSSSYLRCLNRWPWISRSSFSNSAGHRNPSRPTLWVYMASIVSAVFRCPSLWTVQFTQSWHRDILHTLKLPSSSSSSLPSSSSSPSPSSPSLSSSSSSMAWSDWYSIDTRIDNSKCRAWIQVVIVSREVDLFPAVTVLAQAVEPLLKYLDDDLMVLNKSLAKSLFERWIVLFCDAFRCRVLSLPFQEDQNQLLPYWHFSLLVRILQCIWDIVTDSINNVLKTNAGVGVWFTFARSLCERIVMLLLFAEGLVVLPKTRPGCSGTRNCFDCMDPGAYRAGVFHESGVVFFFS